MSFTPAPRTPARSAARLAGLAGLAALALGRLSATPPLPADQIVAPPPPRVAPVVHPLTDIDQDGNHVDDAIDATLRQARRSLATAQATPEQRAAAQALLDEPVSVEFSFTRPITQADLDAFTRLGGQVTWIYKAVGYGWNGIIPRGQVPAAVATLGPGFNAAEQDRAIKPHLYNATRNARVRGEWDLGYKGDPNITIGIIDTGISASHTDLAGRQQYWKDFTLDAATTPRDKGEHGSHVAGIALGSGAAGGTNPTSILYSDSEFFPADQGYFYPSPVEVPTPSGGTGAPTFSWNVSMTWGPTGSLRSPELYYGLYQTTDDPSTSANEINFWTLTSKATKTASPVTASATGIATPLQGTFSTGIGNVKLNSSIFTNIPQRGAAGTWGTSTAPTVHYSAVTTLTAENGNKFSVGDNNPLLSGVAPECKWAGFKVFADDGTGSTTQLSAALDDLAVQASANNIKVANMSLGSIGGTVQSVRDKANAAVNAGVCLVVSQGNDGPSGTPTDPARAGKVITVAASNTDNQLTEYTTNGFTGGVDAGGDAIKPDIMAPGGSSNRSLLLSVDSNDSDCWTKDVADARPNDYKAAQGTSMASPFVAGSAALVIDAWQKTGHTWHFGSSADPLFVKSILCATATESNQPRETSPFDTAAPVNSPTLGRATTPKDGREGYGMINVDAAIECLTRPFTANATETLGSGRFDKRASGFNVALTSGGKKTFTLAVPAGADYDLYLYGTTPDANGNPVILAHSDTAATGGTETITYTPTATATGYIVVKRVSGSGAFTLSTGVPVTPPTVTTAAATGVTMTGATLNATVNPSGSATNVVFEWGPTTAYGQTTAAVSAGSGAVLTNVSKTIAGLSSGSVYHVRAKATNSGGTTTGADVVFRTPFALSDAASALRVAAGLITGGTGTIDRLNIATAGASANRIDTADALLIARKATGKNPNP